MAITDKDILELLNANRYLDAVKRYEEKYGVSMRDALAIIRPLWRELRMERSRVRPERQSGYVRPVRPGREDIEQTRPTDTEEETFSVPDEESSLENLRDIADELLEDAKEMEADMAAEQEEDIEFEIEELEPLAFEEEDLAPPPPPNDDYSSMEDKVLEAIEQLLKKGNMEAAAKVYEEAFKVNITEAINEVFQIKGRLEKEEKAKQREAEAQQQEEKSKNIDYQSGQTYTISPEILELVKSGNKIAAVKRFREIYNTSLKDSKHFIDEIAARL